MFSQHSKNCKLSCFFEVRNTLWTREEDSCCDSLCPLRLFVADIRRYSYNAATSSHHNMLIPIILEGLSNEEDPEEQHSIDSPSMLRLSLERPSMLKSSIERLTRQTSNLSMEETLVATTTESADGTTNRVRPRSWCVYQTAPTFVMRVISSMRWHNM